MMMLLMLSGISFAAKNVEYYGYSNKELSMESKEYEFLNRYLYDDYKDTIDTYCKNDCSINATKTIMIAYNQEGEIKNVYRITTTSQHRFFFWDVTAIEVLDMTDDGFMLSRDRNIWANMFQTFGA